MQEVYMTSVRRVFLVFVTVRVEIEGHICSSSVMKWDASVMRRVVVSVSVMR